jgi:hypothetical protein
MTLIATWVTPQGEGVIMVADTSLVKKGLGAPKITYGLQKLFKIPYLKAAVSFYGDAKLFGEEKTDQWLSKFIEKHKSCCKTIKQFSEHLLIELNKYKTEKNTGFHIAGFEKNDSESYPALHHLTNKAKNDYFNEDLVEFHEAGFPDRAENGKLIHNGDYFIFSVILKSLIQTFLEISERFRSHGINWRIPGVHSLESYADFMNMLFSTTFRAYDLSNKEKVVGGQITTIIISPSGVTEFKK